MRKTSCRSSVISTVCALVIVIAVPSFTIAGLSNAAFASNVPRCGGVNFVGGWVGKNGATGTSIFELAFVNDGHLTCRLAGYPTIQGYRNGHQYPLKTGHLKGAIFLVHPTVVRPQMSAEMVVTTSGLCPALNSGNRANINKVIADNTYTLSVKFPESNTAIPIYGLDVDVACGLNVTALGWS